jgi:methylated-DNA-[protein]-cysteine S-methyltransferase
MSIRPGKKEEAAVLAGHYHTDWGTGTVLVSEGNLVGVELPRAALVERVLGESRTVQPVDVAALERWVQDLEAYFRGERLAWKVDEVSLEALGLSSFERAVYTSLLSIAPGVTVSYGALAEMAGYSRAARAVGNAMAANPVPVVVPCHRVIRSDGSLGNYGDDPAWKRRLLAHERAHVSVQGG